MTLKKSRKIIFLLIFIFCTAIFPLGYHYRYYLYRTSPTLDEVKSGTLLSLKAEIAAKGFTWGSPVFLRLFKEENELEIWLQDSEESRYRLYDSFNICKYSGKLGPKRREGDRQAPEGFYYVPQDMLHPNSKFHLALNLGYPNDYDAAHGYSGSFLMIHGKCVSTGCYAMTDEVIEKVYLLAESALQHGQEAVPVHIFPFRLEEEKLKAHKNYKWYAFWNDLREGYTYFEQHRIPPQIVVEDKKYRIKDAQRGI